MKCYCFSSQSFVQKCLDISWICFILQCWVCFRFWNACFMDLWASVYWHFFRRSICCLEQMGLVHFLNFPDCLPARVAKCNFFLKYQKLYKMKAVLKNAIAVVKLPVLYSHKLFTPTFWYFYTDISAISVTFCNSAAITPKRYRIALTQALPNITMEV